MAHQTAYELPNGFGSIYPDASNNEAWIFNFSGTGAAFAATDIPGAAIDMVVGAGEDGLVEILGPLIYEVDAGYPITAEAEVRVTTDASTAAVVFVGFTDRKDATEEQTIVYENASLVTAATDAVGILLEAEQDATWLAVSVKAGADGAVTALTDAADHVVGTWQKVRVSIGGSGDTSYYVDDKLLSHTRSAAVTTSVRLAPTVLLDARNAAVTIAVRNLRCYGPGAES